jgi:protein-S-isoprenylcysteine O-methyltransferase Ste14
MQQYLDDDKIGMAQSRRCLNWLEEHMTLPVLAAALGVATGVPLIRCLWCLAGLIRLFPNHARADRSEWGWLQLTIAPEAYVLSAAALALGMHSDAALADASLVALTCGLAGAAASLGGLAVSLWTFVTFPKIGTGHYIASGQVVISIGPYGWVRHPTYLGVLLMWFGLGLAYRNVFVLALAAGVGALYALYARSEERMMLAAFGDAYSSYRSGVGSFLPKSLRPSQARATARPE